MHFTPPSFSVWLLEQPHHQAGLNFLFGWGGSFGRGFLKTRCLHNTLPIDTGILALVHCTHASALLNGACPSFGC